MYGTDLSAAAMATRGMRRISLYEGCRLENRRNRDRSSISKN